MMEGTLKSPDELVDTFVGLINKYPAIVALIDPFRKEVRFTFALRIRHPHTYSLYLVSLLCKEMKGNPDVRKSATRMNGCNTR